MPAIELSPLSTKLEANSQVEKMKLGLIGYRAVRCPLPLPILHLARDT